MTGLKVIEITLTVILSTKNFLQITITFNSWKHKPNIKFKQATLNSARMKNVKM